jgi:hypothetical protein
MKPNFTEFRLTPRVLARYSLPDIAYPFPRGAVQPAEDAELPLAEILFGLQQVIEDGGADWKACEAAMDQLAHLLASDARAKVIISAGENWWLEIGPVDLDATLVTIQRGDSLIVAITPTQDGCLRVASFHPICAKSARYLTGLGHMPDPQHGVNMRENNWEYALDSSAGMGNVYASTRGEAYLSFWEKGIGVSSDDSVIPEWRAMKELIARPPSLLQAELWVHCTGGARSEISRPER